MKVLRIVISLALCMLIGSVIGTAQHKYVGTKACSLCHKTAKQGNQFGIWEKSKHAGALETLKTEKAIETAKKKGITKPPSEATECIECHTLGPGVEAKSMDKQFKMEDGVQCETCHSAGSEYKSMTVMKDRAKAVAAGLRVFENDAEAEKFCRTCHNEKSPYYKEFNFKEYWEKIKHPVPKG